MTKEEALDWLDTILSGHKPGESKLWDAISMARDALRSGTEECEACKIHYDDDLK